MKELECYLYMKQAKTMKRKNFVLRFKSKSGMSATYAEVNMVISLAKGEELIENILSVCQDIFL